MSTSAYENAAAMLRRQQRTTARLKVGLPALLAHLEHTEVLPLEATDPPDGDENPATDPSTDPTPGRPPVP